MDFGLLNFYLPSKSQDIYGFSFCDVIKESESGEVSSKALFAVYFDEYLTVDILFMQWRFER